MMTQEATEVLFKDAVSAISGTALAVHKELGPGFRAAVYQEALEIELQNRSIPFESQSFYPSAIKGAG